jgi:hypothetical protein
MMVPLVLHGAFGRPFAVRYLVDFAIISPADVATRRPDVSDITVHPGELRQRCDVRTLFCEPSTGLDRRYQSLELH